MEVTHSVTAALACLSEAKSSLRVQTNQDDRKHQVFAIHPTLIQIYLSFCWMV